MFPNQLHGLALQQIHQYSPAIARNWRADEGSGTGRAIGQVRLDASSTHPMRWPAPLT